MPLIQNYIHFVWATWDRRPIIEPQWEGALYSQLREEAERVSCVVLALGGIEDHIHLLLSLPATTSIAEVMKQVKGASSLFVNARLSPNEYFRWQHEYSAFSVSRWDRPKIMAYVNKQKEHHANGTTKIQLELPPPKEPRGSKH